MGKGYSYSDLSKQEMNSSDGLSLGCAIFAGFGLFVGIISFIASLGNPNYDTPPEFSGILATVSALVLLVIYVINSTTEKSKEKSLQLESTQLEEFLTKDVHLFEQRVNLESTSVKEYKVKLEKLLPEGRSLWIRHTSPEEAFINAFYYTKSDLVLESNFQSWNDDNISSRLKMETQKTYTIHNFRGIFLRINDSVILRYGDSSSAFAFVVENTKTLFDILFENFDLNNNAANQDIKPTLKQEYHNLDWQRLHCGYSDNSRINNSTLEIGFTKHAHVVYLYCKLSNDRLKSVSVKKSSSLHLEFEEGDFKYYKTAKIVSDSNGQIALFEIGNKDLELFSSQKISHAEYTIEGRKIFEHFPSEKNFNAPMSHKSFFSHVFMEYSKRVKDYTDRHSINTMTQIPITEEACYLYLMQDLRNGYYKIGISKTPDYREKTLQSEQPLIESLGYKKFPSRKFALAFEKALHDTYAKQRKRGEWFNLDKVDVDQILNMLRN